MRRRAEARLGTRNLLETSTLLRLRFRLHFTLIARKHYERALLLYVKDTISCELSRRRLLVINIPMKCVPLLGDVDISDYTGLFDKVDHENLLLKYSF